MKDKIFEYYCQRTACVYNVCGTIPSTLVSKVFKISLYKTRKYIKELVNEGLLVSNIEVFRDDYEYPPAIIRGYCLTKKGFETNVYKQISKKEIEKINAMFKEMIEEEENER